MKKKRPKEKTSWFSQVGIQPHAEALSDEHVPGIASPLQRKRSWAEEMIHFPKNRLGQSQAPPTRSHQKNDRSNPVIQGFFDSTIENIQSLYSSDGEGKPSIDSDIDTWNQIGDGEGFDDSSPESVEIADGVEDPRTYSQWVSFIDQGQAHLALDIHRKSFAQSYSASIGLEEVQLSYKVLKYLHTKINEPSSSELSDCYAKLMLIKAQHGLVSEKSGLESTVPFPLKSTYEGVSHVGLGVKRVFNATFGSMDDKLRIAEEHDRAIELVKSLWDLGTAVVPKVLGLCMPFLIKDMEKLIPSISQLASLSTSVLKYIISSKIKKGIKKKIAEALSKNLLNPTKALKGKALKGNLFSLTVFIYENIGRFERMSLESRALMKENKLLYNTLRELNFDLLWLFFQGPLIDLKMAIVDECFDLIDNPEKWNALIHPTKADGQILVGDDQQKDNLKTLGKRLTTFKSMDETTAYIMENKEEIMERTGWTEAQILALADDPAPFLMLISQ